MYKRLLDHKFKFVQLTQRHLKTAYKGRILDVDPETVLIQTYDNDGSEAGQYVVSLSSITDVLVNHPELDKLALKINLALTLDDEPHLLEPLDYSKH